MQVRLWTRISRSTNDLLDRAGKIIRMKAERPRFAFERDLSIALNQVEAVRPAGVSGFRLIVKVINQRRELDMQLPNASASHGRALLLVTRTAEQNIIADIALHLPDVGRMSFKNVDGVEVDFALVLLGQLVQGGNLPPKRRSGIAAENENDWPLRP